MITLTTTVLSPTQVRLNWVVSSDIVAPLTSVEQVISGQFREIASVPSTTKSFVVPNLFPGQTYSFRITPTFSASAISTVTLPVADTNRFVATPLLTASNVDIYSVIGTRQGAVSYYLTRDLDSLGSSHFFLLTHSGSVTTRIPLPASIPFLIAPTYFEVVGNEVLIFTKTQIRSTTFPVTITLGPVKVFRLKLENNALTALDSGTEFGGTDSIPAGILRLESGGVIAFWYENATTSDFSQNIGISYRPPGSAVWDTAFPININANQGNAANSNTAICQHPVDKSIWLFLHRDSYASISAVRLVEQKPFLTQILPFFITHTKHGVNGPEGEHPKLNSVPDVSKGVIRLSYQRADYLIFSTSPIFVKGAHVAVANIHADNSVTFENPLPQFIERISPFGIAAIPEGAALLYQPLFDANTYISTSPNWVTPMILGAVRSFAYNRGGTAEFLTSAQDGVKLWTI